MGFVAVVVCLYVKEEGLEFIWKDGVTAGGA